MAAPRRKGSRKVKKNIPTGVVYIQATFNNTVITISTNSSIIPITPSSP